MTKLAESAIEDFAIELMSEEVRIEV